MTKLLLETGVGSRGLLVALEGEEGGFEAGKKSRAENQSNNRAKEEGESDCRHPSPDAARAPALRWKTMGARLPVISAEPRLSFP